MVHETDFDYHSRRLQAELRLAYRNVTCVKAMEAHLQLSSLHLQGLREATMARAADRAAATQSPPSSGSLYAKFATGAGWSGSQAEPLRPGGEAMRVPSLPQPF